MIYGYIRVSTKEQNENRQRDAMKKMNIAEKNVFIDKESGSDFNREQYKRLLKRLKKGDVLVIKSIDRLGRDYEELKREWQRLTIVKKIDIKVLDMSLLDTTKSKDLFGTFISDLVLQILSFVAENERKNIKQRQTEGIVAAKDRGVKFGRPRVFDINVLAIIYERVKKGEINNKAAIEIMGCSKSTYYRLLKEMKKEGVS